MADLFKIVGGKLGGNDLVFDGALKAITINGRSIALKDIHGLEVIEAKMIDKGGAVTFGLVGALLGGPIGAAVGASLSGLTAPITFTIQTKGGEAYVCEGVKIAFGRLNKAWKIEQVNTKL